MSAPIQEGRLFNVRRLVALDMGLHGRRFILTEYSLGVPVPMIIGVSLVFQGFLIFGAYIFTLGINYMPFLVYAVALRKTYGDAVDMQDPGTRKLNRKYSVQQFLIFIPFFPLALALVQWRRTRGPT